MYDSRKTSPQANYQDYTVQYVNVEHPQQCFAPCCNKQTMQYNQLSNIKPVKYYTKVQPCPPETVVNLPANSSKLGQFAYPLKTCLLKPAANETEQRESPRGVFRNFCSFWTKSCGCDQGSGSARTPLVLPRPSRVVLSKRSGSNPAKCNEVEMERKPAEPIAKPIVEPKAEPEPEEPVKPTPMPDTMPNQDIPNILSDLKSLNITPDVHVSLAEKLSNKLDRAQERILELEREKIILEQSITTMRSEMDDYINCVKQSESVMDMQHNYSTALLNSVIDFCCSLSTPNKHHEIRQAVRAFALDLFQVLVNNNAPNNHIAEMISLNGILAETSYVDSLNTPKQLAPGAAKAVFKSSKPLSTIRPL